MWYIINSDNKIIGKADLQPDVTDLSSRSEEAIENADESIAMGSLWNGITFTPPVTPVESLPEAIARKTLELSNIRQQKLASVLGTTTENLINHEAHIFRIINACLDARMNPSEWVNKSINGTVMGNDTAAIVSFADDIIATQRITNEDVEVIINEFNVKNNAVTSSTTVGEVNAVSWV